MTTTPNQPDREREANVEAMARVLYCAMENVSAEHNQAHLGCYFAPFNDYANDESKILFDEYRVGARAALAFRDADRAGEGEHVPDVGNMVLVPRTELRELRLADGACGRNANGCDQRWDRALHAICVHEHDPTFTPATPLLDDETVERN